VTRRPRLGDRVSKVMGVRESGTVVAQVGCRVRRIPYRECTDGTYRDPRPLERVVYVRWDNGTVGWVHLQFLQPEAQP